MTRKIVRDIQRNSKKQIDLTGPVKKNVRKSTVAPSSRKSNLVDLSVFEKEKNAIITSPVNSQVNTVADLGPRTMTTRVSHRPEGEVIFKRVEDVPGGRLDRLGELVRMVAIAILILFAVNLVSIYQKGIVLKNNVIASAFDGYQSLLQAGNSVSRIDASSASGDFEKAKLNFESALNDLSYLKANTDIFLAKEKTVESVKNLLEAASKISSAGEDFMEGFNNMKNLPMRFMQANMAYLTSGSRSGGTGPSLTDELKNDLVFMENAGEKIIAATNNLEAVSEDVLPITFRAKFQLLKQKVRQISTLVSTLREQIPAILDLLGDRYPHRYLVLLQNDSEARPTGGFIGSFLVVDIDDGYLTKMGFHDVYEFDGQLKEDITPPPDIAKVSKNWRLRDSNYSPDFPLSAQKANWFLQKEKGPNVDSVIAVNQNLLADLFTVTGPVTVPGLKAPLTKENYQNVLSYIIESKMTGVESPKTVLGDFIPVFIKQLFRSSDLRILAAQLSMGIEDGDVMAYSSHQDVQALFDLWGISGRTKKTESNQDYLAVVGTSIGGNKSDFYLEQKLDHSTLVMEDGSVVDELLVTRTHHWSKQNLEKLKNMLGGFGFSDFPDYLLDILGRGTNKAFIKVYVPRGSELIATDGIDKSKIETHQDQELDKTFFMFEMDVNADSTEQVRLSYRLPFRLDLSPISKYQFFVQGQPAINKTQFHKLIMLKPGLDFYANFPESKLKKNENGILEYDGTLSRLTFLSALIGK